MLPPIYRISIQFVFLKFTTISSFSGYFVPQRRLPEVCAAFFLSLIYPLQSCRHRLQLSGQVHSAKYSTLPHQYIDTLPNETSNAFSAHVMSIITLSIICFHVLNICPQDPLVVNLPKNIPQCPFPSVLRPQCPIFSILV